MWGGLTEDRYDVGQVAEHRLRAGPYAHVRKKAECQGCGEGDDRYAGFVCDGEDSGRFAVAGDAVERSYCSVKICSSFSLRVNNT